MSNFNLIKAAFSAIFAEEDISRLDGIPFRSTYIMGPPAGDSDRADLSIKSIGNIDKPFTVSVPLWYTGDQLKAVIQEKTGISIGRFNLFHGSKCVRGVTALSDYGIESGSTIFGVMRLAGGGNVPAPSALSLSTVHLDPRYDIDFSDVKDDGTTYMRGGFVYHRPYGWTRMAIKALGEYINDEWLGQDGIRTEESPGEWPVCYHGTKIRCANPILKEGFKPGPRAAFGSGIYTSPSLEMVEKFYAKEFTHGGKSYKIAFQNRVNPYSVKVIPASQTGIGADYWLSPSGDDVRPYGILIREV